MIAFSLFVNSHDGWKSEGQESCFWVADREEVCPALRAEPYLGGSLPPHSLDSTERPESLPGSLLSPSEGSPSTPRALHVGIVQLGAAGERSSRPAELHRQCSVLCRPSESVDSWEAAAAAAAAACQPRRSRPRPAAVRTRASSWEERICAGSHPHRTRAIQVPDR